MRLYLTLHAQVAHFEPVEQAEELVLVAQFAHDQLLALSGFWYS